MIKKEQYERLQEFRPYLIQAKSNFCRISNSNLRTVSDIYFEVSGKRLTSQQLNCTSCVLKMLKELATQVETYEKVVNAMRESRKKKETETLPTEPVANSNQTEQEPVE